VTGLNRGGLIPAFRMITVFHGHSQVSLHEAVSK